MANHSTSSYERHLQRACSYIRFHGGSPPTASAFPSEREILEQNHRFIRDGDTLPDIDEEKLLARKYYDSLFREYALVDLSRWREQKVALRWRTKDEVLAGVGQFTCGCLNYHREGQEDGDARIEELKTFELNFAYGEDGVKKNSLVKVCVCPKCSRRLRKAQRHDDEKTEPSHRRRRRRHDDSYGRSRSPQRGSADQT